MSIIVTGGDGYLGWPTALRIADRTDERVVVVEDPDLGVVFRGLPFDGLALDEAGAQGCVLPRRLGQPAVEVDLARSAHRPQGRPPGRGRRPCLTGRRVGYKSPAMPARARSCRATADNRLNCRVVASGYLQPTEQRHNPC